MKNIKLQILIGLLLILLSIFAYSIIPNFETQEFDRDTVESISKGETTTTLLNANELPSANEPEETVEEKFEIKEPTVIQFNNSKRIDKLFTTYLIIGSDKRSDSSSDSRGDVGGERADVLILGLVDKNNQLSLISLR